VKRRWWVLTISAVFCLFLLLPPFALAWATRWFDVRAALSSSAFRSALWISIASTFSCLLLVVTLGTPLAWSLATAGTRGSRIARLIETLVQLPMVLPPAVAGVALLAAFGPLGLLGGLLARCGWSPVGSTMAVVLAEVFVAAPIYLQAAIQGFRRMRPEHLLVARTLGASPVQLFFRMVLPMAMPALVSGAALSFARALGEFGATLMFAGSVPGKTRTLTLEIYAALPSDLPAVRALSCCLLAFALSILLGLRLFARGATAEGVQA
jgi:molybdate transport system permease protein